MCWLWFTVYVAKRENPIVNRLNKTKIEKEVDHEQEKTDRLKAEAVVRRAAAAEQVSYLDPTQNDYLFRFIVEKSRFRICKGARGGESGAVVREPF